MDTVSAILVGSNLQILILCVIFLSVIVVVSGVGFWIFEVKSPVDRRLQEISGFSHEEHVDHKDGSFDVSWADPVAKIIRPSDDWKVSKLKSKMVQAGYRSKSAVTIFLFFKLVLAVVFPIVMAVPLGVAISADGINNQLLFLLVIVSFMGFLLPNYIVNNKIKKRQVDIVDAFPDALDLLVVCVEAGLSLDSAILRVAKEISFSWPVLGEELQLLSLELRAGKSRQESLDSLAARTGLPEIQALVSILIQAEHFGTSIASSLRDHADEMRLERIQKAKETAAKLPVRMAVPIILFIFPALFLVLLGPAALSIYQALIVPN